MRINKDRVMILYSLGYPDNKIAKHLRVSPNGVGYVRQNILKLPVVTKNISISKTQEEILIGTLLGDSSIVYVHSGCTMPHLQFCHCKAQEIYCKTKYNKLKILMSSCKERQYNESLVIKGRVAKVQPVIYCIGKNLEVLKEYRNVFYPNDKKVIPISFIEDKFTAQSLAYLFMDDGCKNQKSYNLNLQCFDYENLQEFALFLERKFGIRSIVKKDKTIYIRYDSTKRMTELIRPYITEDMQYKLQN